MQAKPKGMVVVYGNKAESLLELLINWLQRHPLDKPLANEVILTQSNGIKQWLQQSLAKVDTGLGIAAALEVQLPASYVWQLYRQVLGAQQVSRECLLDLEPMTLRLWRLLHEILPQQQPPELQPLQQYWQQASDNPAQQYHLCQQLAKIFDQYQVYRADWLELWQQGQALITTTQQATQALAAEQAWQAWLWQLLVQDAQRTTANALSSARSQIHQDFIQLLQQQAKLDGVELPQRIIVFGISSLPAQSLQALQAISNYTQVLFLVQNPSQYYWADILSDKDLIKQHIKSNAKAVVKKGSAEHGHPLLAAWGKQGRDFIHLLAEYANDQPLALQEVNLYESTLDSATGASLLQQIQDDILQLRSLDEIRQRGGQIDPQLDHSIRFYNCYSAKREVEVLHNQLLQLFCRDKNLQPGDVLVLVPDIDSYAAYIRAVFGSYKSDDPRYIAYSLNDQSMRQDAPLIAALESLLNLPDARFKVSELLALLDVAAIRNKFGIAEHELPLLKSCILQANIRWGLDQQQTEQLGLPPQQQNTWLFGCKRMLLGLALEESSSWQQIIPLTAASNISASALSGLLIFLESLERYWLAFNQQHSSLDWCALLRQLLTDFLATETEAELQLLIKLDQKLDRWQHLAELSGLTDMTAASADSLIPFALVKEYWLENLSASRQGAFLSGGVTFASLLPMRAVPFKVICLLGMNDGDFPRPKQYLNFDLMQHSYRPGDRSRRDDDLYLMLETVLSARQQLYISWVGQNIQDNSELPPSLLVAQLKEHIDQGWQLSGGSAAAKQLTAALTTKHPMQAFSRCYYQAEQQTNYPSFAYEWESLYQQKPSNLAPTTTALLSDWHDATALVVNLENELIAFVKHPVKYFFNNRLHVYFSRIDEADFDTEPIEFDGLTKWQVLDSLLWQQLSRMRRAQQPPLEQAQLVEQLSAEFSRLQLDGSLPTGVISSIHAPELIAIAAQQLDCYQQLAAEYPQLAEQQLKQRLQVEFTLELLQQQRQQLVQLQADLTSLASNRAGELLQLSFSASKLVDKGVNRLAQIMPFWLQHLLLQLSSEQAVTSKIIHQNGCLTLKPLEPQLAQQQLVAWLTAWYQGHNYPLPLVAASYSYANSLLKTQDAVKAKQQAQQQYSGAQFGGRRAEVETELVLQAAFPDFEQLFNTEYPNPQHNFTGLITQLILPMAQYIVAESFA